MELSERKLKILKAIIDDYISTGIPVGSRTLSKKPELNYSSATIRNEMADMEEMGYLDKLHTSAGRMPSDAAYRLYVDKLMPIGELSSTEAEFIRSYFDQRVSEISQVLDMAARVISDTTNNIALVAAPQWKNVTIKRIQLVKITETKCMLIFVTDNGIVEDEVISVPPMLESQQMERLSNMLTEMVRNIPIAQAAQKIEEIARMAEKEQRHVLNEVFAAINSNSSKKEMVLDGAQNIFKYPEYKDVAKAQHFLELLDTKDRLYTLLRNAGDVEFSIKIGRENDMEDFNDMSVVTATYKAGGKSLGSFGVIGPTRMDYSRVLSVLNYVGMSLNEILSCFLEADTQNR